jgi:hypothetical protein
MCVDMQDSGGAVTMSRITDINHRTICKHRTIEEIRAAFHVLLSERAVHAAPAEDDPDVVIFDAIEELVHSRKEKAMYPDDIPVHDAGKEPRAAVPTDIEKRFSYHAPKNEHQTMRYAAIRSAAKDFAYMLIQLTPSSREQSLSLTHLEECVMFANAAIARNE